MLAGIVAILFGLFAIAMPGAMLASLVLFFGIFAIAEALILLFGGSWPAVPAPCTGS